MLHDKCWSLTRRILDSSAVAATAPPSTHLGSARNHPTSASPAINSPPMHFSSPRIVSRLLISLISAAPSCVAFSGRLLYKTCGFTQLYDFQSVVFTSLTFKVLYLIIFSSHTCFFKFFTNAILYKNLYWFCEFPQK